MLPLISKITPSETGASSLEKVLISCRSFPSNRLKFSRSSPVTSRFIGSVMVTGTSTISTFTLSGLLWLLSPDSMSDALGAGCGRGWMCTSSAEFCAKVERALSVAKARKTTNAERDDHLFAYNIGPTRGRQMRTATEARGPRSRERTVTSSSERDTSTILNKRQEFLRRVLKNILASPTGCHRSPNPRRLRLLSPLDRAFF